MDIISLQIKQKDEFIEKTKLLFQEIKKWVKDQEIEVVEESKNLYHSEFNDYKIPVLILKKQDFKIVFEPRCNFLFYFTGTISIKTRYDNLYLYYLSESGYRHSYKFTTDTGRVLFPGESIFVDEKDGGIGWVFVQNSHLKSCPIFEKDLLFEIIKKEL